MKYRRNKVKREHTIIEDALQWLEELSANSEVEDIIPGVIDTAHTPDKGVIYKYQTHTGCKLLLKSNGSIQEVFVVTKDPEFVRLWVEKHFPSSERPRSAKASKLRDKTDVLDSQLEAQSFDEEIEEAWMREVVKMRRNQRQAKRKVRRGRYEYDERGFVTIDDNLRNQVLQQWNSDSDEANIADLVNPDVRSALEKLKDQLEQKSPRAKRPSRK